MSSERQRIAKKKWSSLHHEVWRIIQKNLPLDYRKSKFLVCVSGGLDSMALFHVMKDLPLKVEVFHAHHGPGNNVKFRDDAESFVQQLCHQEKIHFVTSRSHREMTSEEEFRKFRISFLKKWTHQNPQGVIVMAHHIHDLLETRLIRLIRGTGPQGLQSMSLWKAPVLRPFLEIERGILKDFLRDRNLEWCEDPSNRNTKYFRNWIRHRWLPQLEKAKPGSVKRLAHSLEHVSVTVLTSVGKTAHNKSIERSHYTSLNPRDQLQHLASLLKNQGMTHFTSGQLKEVQKRLDNPQGRLMFEAAGALWTVNAQRILVKPL